MNENKDTRSKKGPGSEWGGGKDGREEEGEEGEIRAGLVGLVSFSLGEQAGLSLDTTCV